MPDLVETFKLLGPLDYIFIAVLLLSIFLGTIRGFVQVAMSLAGWFVGLAAAHFLASFLVPYLGSTGLGETPRYALAFVVVFVIAIVAWGIITMMIKQAVSSVGLGWLDRLLGGVAGLARGLVIVISLTLLISLSPANQSVTWQNSPAVKMAKAGASSLKPILPSRIADLIP